MPAAISLLKAFRSKCCTGLLTQPAQRVAKGNWTLLKPAGSADRAQKKAFPFASAATQILSLLSQNSATLVSTSQEKSSSYWANTLLLTGFLFWAVWEFWNGQQCKRGRGLYVVLPAALDMKLSYSHFWQLFLDKKHCHGMYLCWLYGRGNFLERIRCFLGFR